MKDDSYGQKAYLDEMSPRHQHQQIRHQIHRLQHRLRLGHDQGPGRAFRQRKEDASTLTIQVKVALTVLTKQLLGSSATST